MKKMLVSSLVISSLLFGAWGVAGAQEAVQPAAHQQQGERDNLQDEFLVIKKLREEHKQVHGKIRALLEEARNLIKDMPKEEQMKYRAMFKEWKENHLPTKEQREEWKQLREKWRQEFKEAIKAKNFKKAEELLQTRINKSMERLDKKKDFLKKLEAFVANLKN